jgi:AraC-like DNA-binding protein
LEEYWGGKLVGHAIPATRHEARLSIPDCVEYVALQTEPSGVFDYEFAGLQIILGCSAASSRWGNRRNFEESSPGTSRLLLPDRYWGEWRGRCVSLGAYVSTSFVARSFERPFGAMNFAHGAHHSLVLENLVRAIDADIRQGNPAGPIFIQSVVLSLLHYLLRSPHPPAKGGLSARRLKAVKELIDDQLACGIDVERLARAASVSASHFSRAFKATTGQSPHQYILRRRVERASQLIYEDACSLAEVAERVGFADGSHMAFVFSKLVGKPPSAFRKR